MSREARVGRIPSTLFALIFAILATISGCITCKPSIFRTSRDLRTPRTPMLDTIMVGVKCQQKEPTQ